MTRGRNLVRAVLVGVDTIVQERGLALVVEQNLGPLARRKVELGPVCQHRCVAVRLHCARDPVEPVRAIVVASNVVIVGVVPRVENDVPVSALVEVQERVFVGSHAGGRFGQVHDLGPRPSHVPRVGAEHV